MREILFRGRDISGQWHYGVPFMFNEDYVCIAKLNEHNKTIEYKTLGQYTGLTDNNDTKIFEGDILNVKSYDYNYEYLTKVFYNSHTLCVDVYGQDYDFTSIGFANDIWDDENCEIEVIGNIYDNPELLEVKE